MAQNSSSYSSQRNLYVGVATAAIVLAQLLGFVLSWSVTGPIQRVDSWLLRSSWAISRVTST